MQSTSHKKNKTKTTSLIHCHVFAKVMIYTQDHHDTTSLFKYESIIPPVFTELEKGLAAPLIILVKFPGLFCISLNQLW